MSDLMGYVSQKLIPSRRQGGNGRRLVRGGGAAGAGVPEVAGRGLEVAARAARLGVGGQDEAVGEGDRGGGAARDGGGVLSGRVGGLGGGRESLVGARAHVTRGHRGADG